MDVGNNGSSRKVLSEINVTPFVDVMLVLLVIFMVTAPLIQHGVKVNLPKADTTAIEPSEKEQLIVTIDKNKNIFILADKYSYEDFVVKILSIAKNKKDKKVFLGADGSLNYDVIIKIMAIMKNAGFEEIGLITEPDIEKTVMKSKEL
ncbi:MAG: protein TolR [Pseudomonadota bacterium]